MIDDIMFLNVVVIGMFRVVWCRNVFNKVVLFVWFVNIKFMVYEIKIVVIYYEFLILIDKVNYVVIRCIIVVLIR